MIMEILMSDSPIYTQGVRVIAVEVQSFPGGKWGARVFIPSTSADEVVVCFGMRVVKLCGQHMNVEFYSLGNGTFFQVVASTVGTHMLIVS